MSLEGYTLSDDYLSISFEGMKEVRKKIISSIDAKKAQRDNISRAIESLQVPDSVLRGYGNDLIPIKNSISKDIEELVRMSSHIDYVMKRFEEVDNEYAARFKSANYMLQEKLGLQRENGIFGCGIAGLTSIVSQMKKAFSGINNALETKAAQITNGSLINKNNSKSLLIAGNKNIIAQAKKMYLSQESSATTNYSVNKATKGEDSKRESFSEEQLRSLEEQLNNSYMPYYVKDMIKKYITDSGAMYFINPKTGDYVVRNNYEFKYNWTSLKIKGATTEFVTDDFKQKVVEISYKLGINPDDLMAVMAFESEYTFDPSFKTGNATGLIQFMPKIAEEMGTTVDALAEMSAIEQLDYVYKYYRDRASLGKLKTLGDVYMVTLWPIAVGKPDDYVLYSKGSKTYEANRSLDIDKDGHVTKKEATQRVIDVRNTFKK